MGSLSKRILFFIIVIILGCIFLLPGVNEGHTEFTIRVISYVNVILLITSLICLSHFFWPGEINHTPFHVFNILFIILFYSFSLDFLFRHKEYYDGYIHLSDFDVIKRFAFRWDIFSIMFWTIMFTMIINVLYVLRNKKAYLQYN